MTEAGVAAPVWNWNEAHRSAMADGRRICSCDYGISLGAGQARRHPSFVHRLAPALFNLNPFAVCTAGEPCTGYEPGPVYRVDARLHHPHGDHCDDHGPVEIVRG